MHNFHSCIRISLISFLAERIFLEIINNTSMSWLQRLSLNAATSLLLMKFLITANLTYFLDTLIVILGPEDLFFKT